jgi:NADH dehydrogenase FAD-containing subunit
VRDDEPRTADDLHIAERSNAALALESMPRDDMAMPPTNRVLVLGSGFAGLWAALGAARRLDELGVPPGAVDVTVISSQPFHDIRVRNYEADLSACRIPLQDLLDPAGVGHITADVTGIDAPAATVSTADGATLGYDRLVVALGSRVVKPDLPGLTEFGYDVDTYDGAMKRRRTSAIWPNARQTPPPQQRSSSVPASPASRPPVSCRRCCRTRSGPGSHRG